MILTCPSCATRYQADTVLIAPPGRNVRCAKCGHVWFQGPPEAEVEPEPEPVPEPIRSPIPEPAPSPMAAASAAAFESSPIVPAHDDAPAGRAMFSRLIGAGGWIALIAVVALLGSGAVEYRQPIAELWPSTASLYAALGAPVNVRGLDFAEVKPDQQFEGGQPVLEVRGNVINVSDHKIPVPEVRVALTDAEGREVYHWTFDPGAGTLAPGAKHPFVTRLTAPPQEAKTIGVRFAEAGEQ